MYSSLDWNLDSEKRMNIFCGLFLRLTQHFPIILSDKTIVFIVIWIFSPLKFFAMLKHFSKQVESKNRRQTTENNTFFVPSAQVFSILNALWINNNQLTLICAYFWNWSHNIWLYTLRQNGLLPRKNVTEILNIVHETTCPQGLRTGFG